MRRFVRSKGGYAAQIGRRQRAIPTLRGTSGAVAPLFQSHLAPILLILLILSKNHSVSTILLLGGECRADAQEAAAGVGERIDRVAHFHLLDSALQRGF